MTDMLGMIRGLGDQLRWAADLGPLDLPDSSSEIILLGMGGSGVSGDYLAAVAGQHGARVSVHKEYGPLPGWVDEVRPLVLAVSYSGNTEETLDSANDALERGLDAVVVSTGGSLLDVAGELSLPAIEIPSGLQPRAAVGYLVGAVAQVGAGSGLLPDQGPALMEAADLVDAAVSESSAPWGQAAEVADALGGRIAIIYGGGPLTSTVAGRWKTQINENAKMPAWAPFFPELNHNEIVGWETLPEKTKKVLGIVALADRSDHPRVGERRVFTEDLTDYAVPWVSTVESWGESAMARLMSLTVVGDLVSWMMAENAGVDPTPVATIEKLKVMLKG